MFLTAPLHAAMSDKVQLEKAQTELKSLQSQLVKSAKKLRIGEQKLADLSNQQRKLTQSISQKKLRLELQKVEINSLLQSLIRLSRTPPEAVIAMPGELRDTLQAAQLMSQLTKTLKARSIGLSNLINQLQSQELELAEIQARAQQQQGKLTASQKALKLKLNARTENFQKMDVAYREKQKAAEIARLKAKSVQQLVSKLEPKRKPEINPSPIVRSTRKIAAPVRKQERKFSQFRGNLPLPVAGSIIEKYGARKGGDQTSHGFTLASSAAATVISPASGEVLFTGPFLDYGNIVIMRYDSGYHLLIAGMESVNCSVGQNIMAGEPIGQLKRSGNNRAELYMELRKNGKAIDPAPWFS